MERKWKSSMFLTGALLLGAIALSGTTAMADVTMDITATLTSSTVETVTNEMDFGTIEIDPAGDTITIDASIGSATPAVTGGGSSAVSGGTSGLITISSAIGFDVSVTYEADSVVVIDNGTTSTFLNSIDTYSMGGTANGSETHAPNVDTLIYVGGEIAFPSASTTGVYTGTTNIIINYI